MDYEKLHNEAMGVTLSDQAQRIVVEIGTSTPDPTEAAILGFSCGMLAVKHFVKEAIEDE